MKLSVIFAILQMSLGILMKGLNAIYFKRRIELFFEFIPQIIVLLLIFGWMDVLIIAKWLTPKDIEINHVDPHDFGKDPNNPYNVIHYSPSIITTMIDIFLGGASNLDANKAVKYNYVVGGDTQGSLSIAFVLIAILSVPVLLCVRPLYVKFTAHHHEDHGPNV
jgi:V-type H+-transporting ATPase subunit a